MRAAGLTSIAALVATIGCVRDPAENVCPKLAVGDLVVTEVRGPQTGMDSLHPFVELFNASSSTIELLGLEVRFRKPDGSGEIDAFVRHSLTAAPGSYTVLGLEDDTMRSSYVDYGFVNDFTEGWLTAATIDLTTCGERIDRMSYSSLPRTGTYSLGAKPPTADANDFPAQWCTDPTMGTPKQANAACP